jgi:hypothetical protein
MNREVLNEAESIPRSERYPARISTGTLTVLAVFMVLFSPPKENIRIVPKIESQTLFTHCLQLIIHYDPIPKTKKTKLRGLYRPSDRRLSAKLVPTFADIESHVVSVTGPYGRILCFLDRSRYFFFLVAPQLYSRG